MGASLNHSVSVVIPNRNYARFLQECVTSCLIQGEIVSEVLIADGGSSDDSLEVISKLCAIDSRVRLVSTSDSGQSDALNIAFSKVTSEYVVWLNSDEILLPGMLPYLLAQIRQDTDCVFGDAVFIDEESRCLKLHTQHRVSRFVLTHYGPHIQSCTAIFRVDSIAALDQPPWDKRLERLMDLDLYLRLLESGARFQYVSRPVAGFRIHSEQVTASDLFGRRELEREVIATKSSNLATSLLKFEVARQLHRFLKVFNGGYIRQISFRSKHGEPVVKVLSK